MVLILLTIIFFIGGFLAIFYSMLALLSMLKYSRAQKILPEKYETEPGKPNTAGPPVADAFCRRARILLQNQRFDAALADCKRAIDINANHAEAHTLWEHALEKETPPGLLAEHPAAVAVPTVDAVPAVDVVPAKKKVKKVVKKIKRQKRVEEKAEDIPPPTGKKPEKETAPEDEILLEDELKLELGVQLKQAEDKTEIQVEPEVEVEPVSEPPVKTETAEKVKKKIAEKTVKSIPVPEVEIPLEEEFEIELETVETGPEIQLESEAEVKPVSAPPVEPEAPDEVKKRTKKKTVTAPEAFPGDEQGPLIPEDKLIVPKPPGESLLEEFDREKLKEFEEGEAGAGDREWTRYADKNAPELAKSKINMNELPSQAVGLKETLIDLRQAEAYNLQGETNISKNLYNNAIKDFSRALAINPNYIDALINRGSAYAQLGRFNDALIDFNHALKFEKKDPELYNKRGEVYMQNNMYDQAIKDFTNAIVLNPMFSDAYLNRGRAYSEKGMPDEAMTDFNQAIKADSDHSYNFIDRAAPGVNIDSDKTGDEEETEQYNEKGLADLESGKIKEAVENFTHAINLSQSNAESYINRGRAFITLDKADEAMADFNQAVLFDPLNATLYYWRAQAWKAKQDQFNMTEDLKLSCEMGHEPACLEYKKLKPAKK